MTEHELSIYEKQLQKMTNYKYALKQERLYKLVSITSTITAFVMGLLIGWGM